MENNFAVDYPLDERELKTELEALQQQWAASLSSQQDRDNFCNDGFYPFYTHQKTKVLFIGQESYGMGGCDFIEAFYNVLRRGKFNTNESINKSRFHHLIFYVAYGILKDFPKWSDVPYPSKYREEIFTEHGISFAFMNLSKFSAPGNYRRTDWGDVMRSVREGAANIKKEVELLAPDIVITMSFLRNQEIRSVLFDTCEAVDCTDPNVRVYRAINGGKHMLVLDTWHFSALKSEFECYYQPIEQALRKHYSQDSSDIVPISSSSSQTACSSHVDPRYRLISEIAEECSTNGSTMFVTDLARRLNERGLKTSYGSEYAGGRGTYRLIRAAYWCYERMEEHDKAKHIADSFVNAKGNCAWW